MILLPICEESRGFGMTKQSDDVGGEWETTSLPLVDGFNILIKIKRIHQGFFS